MHILAIDEGTTGVRALIFDRSSRVLGAAYREIHTLFPEPGWVEQDPVQIWHATRAVIRDALANGGLRFSQIAAIGITNQRATTVVWERSTGRPVHPAINWQDVRTARRVEELWSEGVFATAMSSATKLEWIVRQQGARSARALCFGTIDTWLAWNLSGGRAHVTDPSNASCTGLYDFGSGGWDEALLERLGLPIQMLPRICRSSEHFIDAGASGMEAVPLAALAGDQQAAMFGELGTEPGAIKVTCGTSAMVDVNTGERPVPSRRGAYPLILWSIDASRPFCLEGTVITAGAAVQWLCDGLGLIRAPEESGPVAASVPDSAGVWALPALQGLGTPHLDSGARGQLGGLSRGVKRAHVVRAVLEGIAFRIREVVQTLVEDTGIDRPAALRVDGGAAGNDFLLQTLASVLGIPVERPATLQASALGAAYLAGLAVGFWSDTEELRLSWRCGGTFEPRWSEDEREERFRWWRDRAVLAVGRKD